ncbi:MAG: hypothetical protein QXD11_00895 [Candidatus Micrarchaeaceae archaeon]
MGRDAASKNQYKKLKQLAKENTKRDRVGMAKQKLKGYLPIRCKLHASNRRVITYLTLAWNPTYIAAKGVGLAKN